MAENLLKLFAHALDNCSRIETPSVEVFINQLPPSFVVGITIATILSLSTLMLGLLHLLYIALYMTHIYRKVYVFYLAGTAPFVSMFALAAMYMPRIWFLAHLLNFFYFCIALYVIICLLMHIVNGRHSVVKRMHETSRQITVQTPPFCCVFPCLPKLSMETRKIRFCEMMVMQTPVVRLVHTVVSLVIYFEYKDTSILLLKVIDLVSLPSLLVGIYGCHILVSTVSKLDELCPYRYIKIFQMVDLFLMFYGLQQPLFVSLAQLGVFGCGNATLSAIDTAYFWKNFATVSESFVVSIISSMMLKPSESALFDKHPSSQSIASASSAATLESTA